MPLVGLDAAQFEARHRVNVTRETERLVRGPHATARHAHVDIDENAHRNARTKRRLRECGYVAFVIDNEREIRMTTQRSS